MFRIIEHITEDRLIAQALDLVDEETLNMIYDDARVISFYNLEFIDPEAKYDYAISTIDNFGNEAILINQRYKDSGKEALACLITHEANHRTKTGFKEWLKSLFGKGQKVTLQEEIKCTTKEAEAWKRLKPETYPDNELTQRLDKISNIESIPNYIKGISKYRGLV